MKIYGSKQCPDCRKCKATLEANSVEFEFIDITEGLLNLKQFLRYRDNQQMFDRFKATGKVGIPFLVLRTALCSMIGRAGAERTASRL